MLLIQDVLDVCPSLLLVLGVPGQRLGVQPRHRAEDQFRPAVQIVGCKLVRGEGRLELVIAEIHAYTDAGLELHGVREPCLVPGLDRDLKLLEPSRVFRAAPVVVREVQERLAVVPHDLSKRIGHDRAVVQDAAVVDLGIPNHGVALERPGDLPRELVRGALARLASVGEDMIPVVEAVAREGELREHQDVRTASLVPVLVLVQQRPCPGHGFLCVANLRVQLNDANLQGYGQFHEGHLMVGRRVCRP